MNFDRQVHSTKSNPIIEYIEVIQNVGGKSKGKIIGTTAARLRRWHFEARLLGRRWGRRRSVPDPEGCRGYHGLQQLQGLWWKSFNEHARRRRLGTIQLSKMVWMCEKRVSIEC